MTCCGHCATFFQMNGGAAFGDECEAPQSIAPGLFQTMIKHSEELGYSGECLYDTICESYKDVAGLFKASEKEVRQEIGIYLEELKEGYLSAVNEYGIDVNDPYHKLSPERNLRALGV